MRTKLRAALRLLLLLLAAVRLLAAQTAAPASSQTSSPTVVLQGLRSTANHGGFKAARFASDGTLLLLYDGGDGVRLLRADPAASNVLAEVQVGAAGDVGVALALDPAGDIYVVGTSTSGALAGTAGVVFPQVQDRSTNSFLARFDPGLNLQFLTFLGTGKTAVTGVVATADAVFVTGTTFGSSFPTTAGAALPQAGSGSSADGFVERFTTNGRTLGYSTLLTGNGGDTESFGIVADASDHAYVIGETSAASFPTVAALVPVMSGATAGFFAELTAAGDAFVFSSFVPGTGLTGIDLDPTGGSLLLTGNVDIARFPIANVSGPIANTIYQSLLRWSADGKQLLSSTLLAPGVGSQVTAAPDGTAWVSGSLSVPLFAPGSLGGSFFAHVNAQALVDVDGRFGGTVAANAGSATLVGAPGAPAVDTSGAKVAFPATLEATVNATPILPRFDVPLTAAPDGLLPNLPSDLLPGSCDGTGQCLGSAGLLALLEPSGKGPSLSLSMGDSPSLTLRNGGSVDATGVTISAPGLQVGTDCTSTLGAYSQCGILLAETGPVTLTIASSGAGPLVVPLPSPPESPPPLVLSTSELDFGIVTASSPASRTVTVTNLSGSAQSFRSGGDGLAPAPPYSLTESGSTCAGSPAAHMLAPNSVCTLTLSLVALPNATEDGPVQANWEIAGQEVAITGITEAADLSLSSAQVDFGTNFAASATPILPRYLYLSNSSDTPYPHALVTSPATGPFSVLDECPSTLEPKNVCRLTITYAPVVAPSLDSMTVTLDGGLNAVVEGEFLAGTPVPANLPQPTITVDPASVAFADPVSTTAMSTAAEVITLSNSGAGPVPLTLDVAGDFSMSNACGPTLASGASCEVSVQFTPSQPGLRNGLLRITTGNGYGALSVPLTGTGAPLLPPTNGTLALGASPVGEPAFAWYKVSAALNTLTAAASGASFQVAIVEDDGTGHGTLPASAFAPLVTHSCSNCWLGVVMVPGSAGLQTGTLTLTTVAGGRPYPLQLTGSGTSRQGLVVTPSQADLGTVPVGSTSAPLTFALANLLSPNAGVSVRGITSSGDFQVVPTADGQLPCTGEINATATCRFAVSFSPTAQGDRTGTITVQTSRGSVTVPLSGSAVARMGVSVNPTSLTFRNALPPTGASGAQQTIRLTNSTAGPLTISPVTTTDPAFTPSTTCGVLPPSASCTIAVRFTPGGSEVSGTLQFTAVGGEGAEATSVPYSIPLNGTYTAEESGLVLLPSTVDFGAQTVNTLGQTRAFTLWNASSTTQAVTLDPPQNFPLAAPSSCVALQPGASCTFSLAFLPQTGGPLTGSVLATGTAPSGASSQAIGYLLGYGNGTAQLTLSGDALAGDVVDFGQVVSGATVQHALTLTNSGTEPLHVLQIAAGPPFTVSTDCGAALVPGGQCHITLVYAPSYLLPATDFAALPRADAETLTIRSDATSSPDQVTLTGSALPTDQLGAGGSPLLASYTASAGALTFPNTAPGSASAAQTVTLRNTGSVPLTFAATASSEEFVTTSGCSRVQAGASCVLSVAFHPAGGMGPATRTGTLTIQSNALDALEFVSLLGLSSPDPLRVGTTNLDFGTLPVGDTASLPLSVTNQTTLPITLGALTAVGDYTVQPGDCPLTGNDLPAGQTCTLLIEFAPTTAGIRGGLLSIPSTAVTTPLTVALTGVGTTPKLTISPAALDFGNQEVGTSSALSLSLANDGGAPLVGTAASVSGPAGSDYSVSDGCSPGPLAPAASCTLQVRFAPTAEGARTATLTLTSNDPSGPKVIALNGTGTPPIALNVTVDGESTTTLDVRQGSTASFRYAVTPLGGFQGSVELACLPGSSAPYAVCSLLLGSMDLSGGSSGSTGSITTHGPVSSSGVALRGLLCALPLLLSRRRGRHPRTLIVIALTLSVLLCSASGCGGPGSTGSPLTPRGTYRYSLTATAPGTNPIHASATITLHVE